MNANEFAKDNHNLWLQAENLTTLLNHLDDLMTRIMSDVLGVAREGDCEMAVHGVENDLRYVLSSVSDLHLQMQTLCAGASRAADEFELECHASMRAAS